MVVITAAYVVALAVALLWLTWGPSVGQLWADTLIADIIATLVIFVVSRTVGNSSCYDAYWSVVPVFLALYWWFAGDAIHGGSQAKWRCALLGVVLVVWAVRRLGRRRRSGRYSTTFSGSAAAAEAPALASLAVEPPSESGCPTLQLSR